jgi:hypothetical protein
MSFRNFLKEIAQFQVKHPYYTIAILLALTLAIYGGTQHVRTVASLEKMMPQYIDEIEAFDALRNQGMGRDIIAIVVRIDETSTDPNGVLDIRDERVTDYLNYLEQLLKSETDILTVQSAASRPPTQYYDETYTTTMLLATSDVGDNDERMNRLVTNIKKHLDSAGHPPGVDLQLTGIPVIQQRLGDLVNNDRTNTRWLSTLFVFILTALLFRSIALAIGPILVVTFSVTWLYGTMGYVDLPISTLAGGVAAMVVGIGIDYAIHLMNKYRFERDNGHDKTTAMEVALTETGSALTTTALTTISAFLAFLVGVMPEMGRFGILMAIGIAYSLFYTLFGLPAFLIIEERWNNV